MSQQLIQGYFNELDRIRTASGSNRESVVREAFKDLLKTWGRQHGLVFIAEHEHLTPAKERRLIDGALLHEIRVPFGYWEAKDTDDDLEEEIDKKKRRGYPQDNIIFEDSRSAVLIQDRQEVIRCEMADAPRFLKLMDLFFAYERKEIAEFRKAVEQFKLDLPAVLAALRAKIEEAHETNEAYQAAEAKFLTHAQETINPTLGTADVREMLIQHILTEEIFAKVFDDSDFHTHNNVARELYALEDTFFTGGLKRQALRSLDPYYSAIRSSAAQIASHAEKQTFLKVIYENFYKVYNAKAADRLGVVYTPNEIVRFMIQGADWLCRKHFQRGLIDRNVEILDPATGTGTFITELLEYFRGDKAKLAYKYKEELHANEVAILPYYVANLNIESTFAALTGEYVEFENLCFVDTLDNTAPLGHRAGHQHDLFARFTEENVKRVKRQNARKISVIIGNPPYNANQKNEKENNKNREYPQIDELIKTTYVKASTAQKSKVYDMYARFFRWASDRLDVNGDGIIAFITNRSFIESRTFDGFRKTVAADFNEIWIVDLGGDVRANPKLSGTRHNVFGIQTGVAILFLVRKSGSKECAIHYARRPEFEIAEDKLASLAMGHLRSLDFASVEPDAKGRWINQMDNDFEDLMPIADKQTKVTTNKRQERAIFKLMSLGIATNRDEWIYDHAVEKVKAKVAYFCETFNHAVKEWQENGDRKAPIDQFGKSIKWTSELQQTGKRGQSLTFGLDAVRPALYRPFSKLCCYYESVFVHRPYQQNAIFPIAQKDLANKLIAVSDPTSQKPWMTIATDALPDLHAVGAASGAMCLPLFRYAKSGEKIDNITDWALNRFRDHYEKGKGRRTRSITKDAIFAYVYAVLHDPIYREKYALNLKRALPRIPFYADFWKWSDWGEALMKLHIDYEAVTPFALARTDRLDEKARASGVAPKPILRSDRTAGTITLDSETTLSGVPAGAWTYMLGNRCALDWILDQHKEKSPKDSTILAKFNAYRFADHKEHVVDLLMRVTTVSVETMKIVNTMKALERGAQTASATSASARK